MLIDSHCHLNSIDLTEFNNDMRQVLLKAEEHDVKHLLSVCVSLSDYPELERLAAEFPNISISVGVHPNCDEDSHITADMLCQMAKNPACIAIGETGLDYYRTDTDAARELQRHMFKEHIKASRITNKPLIIHTRLAAEDTLSLMEQEGADKVGGVMHCFAETLDVALKAIDLNFYISFSGIVTFKNATMLQEVAKKAPLNRILIETDAPYLAPVPFRGKQNHPALVKYVAEALADLRGMTYEKIGHIVTNNFYDCFKINKPV